MNYSVEHTEDRKMNFIIKDNDEDLIEFIKSKADYIIETAKVEELNIIKENKIIFTKSIERS